MEAAENEERVISKREILRERMLREEREEEEEEEVRKVNELKELKAREEDRIRFEREQKERLVSFELEADEAFEATSRRSKIKIKIKIKNH